MSKWPGCHVVSCKNDLCHEECQWLLNEKVETAAEAFAKASGYYVPFHRGLSSESADKLRAGIRAALLATR